MDADTRDRLRELLPRARAELETRVGGYQGLAKRLDELDAALASGGSGDEVLAKTADEFGAHPRLLSSTARAAAVADDPDTETRALRELGNLVVWTVVRT